MPASAIRSTCRRTSSKLVSVSDLVREAKRQRENARWSYDEQRKQRDVLLEFQLKEGLFQQMLLAYAGAGSQLLVLGQCAHVLDGDEAAAVESFRELATWLPFLDAALERVPATGYGERSLLEPMVCHLLAGDRTSADKLGAIDCARVFKTDKPLKVMLPWRQFVFDLLDLQANRIAAVKGRKHEPVRDRDLIQGYDRLVAAVVSGDDFAFEAARADASALYRKRSARRESALNWWGEGKVAQAATFDALGTAICRLAHWRGMKLKLEDPLYPHRFWG